MMFTTQENDTFAPHLCQHKLVFRNTIPSISTEMAISLGTPNLFWSSTFIHFVKCTDISEVIPAQFSECELGLGKVIWGLFQGETRLEPHRL